MAYTPCPKCSMVAVKVVTDEQWIPDKHCLMCGWRPTREAIAADDNPDAELEASGKLRRRSPGHSGMKL